MIWIAVFYARFAKYFEPNHSTKIENLYLRTIN